MIPLAVVRDDLDLFDGSSSIYGMGLMGLMVMEMLNTKIRSSLKFLFRLGSWWTTIRVERIGRVDTPISGRGRLHLAQRCSPVH